MGLRDSTTLAPQMFEKPRYVRNHKDFCLSSDEAQHVYRALENGSHVTPRAVVAEAAPIESAEHVEYKIF